MVSVIFDVVSVWLVIEPCVKFGTTGTAFACPEDIAMRTAVAKRGAPTIRAATPLRICKSITKTLHQSITVISETNCPVALLPAPPAVMLMV